MPLPRQAYWLCGNARPIYRGWMMGELLHSGEWMFAAVLYLTATLSLDPTNVTGGFIRVLFMAATVWGLHVSDQFHNMDKILARGVAGGSRKQPSPRRRPSVLELQTAELTALRLDYISISCILTTQTLLWGSNLQWVGSTWVCGVAACVATLGIAGLTLGGMSDSLVWKYRGTANGLTAAMAPWESCVRATFAAQFFAVIGWGLVWQFPSTHFGYAQCIFWVYSCGFASHAIKGCDFARRWQVFGPHEWFHLFIVAGHASAMICDVIQLGSSVRAGRTISAGFGLGSADAGCSGWTTAAGLALDLPGLNRSAVENFVR